MGFPDAQEKGEEGCRKDLVESAWMIGVFSGCSKPRKQEIRVPGEPQDTDKVFFFYMKQDSMGLSGNGSGR
jgi:hypothetical protein